MDRAMIQPNPTRDNALRVSRELVRVLLGSVIAGAMGLLVLILSDGQADALWACAMLIGAAACFLGVSRRGMPLCSLMGLLVAQGAAGVSGVLRADVQPWTDAQKPMKKAKKFPHPQTKVQESLVPPAGIEPARV